MQHLFSTFPKFVDAELDRRRTDNRPGAPTALQKPKSPWMRMTSGFEADSGGREEGRKILMGGDLDLEQKLQFGFEDLYEESAPTGEKYRPKPTLTDISVDEQLDSFECTVNWKAHSIDQIERLFPFFMNVGSSIFVDWGWSDVPPEGIVNVSNPDELKKYYVSLSSDPPTLEGGSQPFQTRTEAERERRESMAEGFGGGSQSAATQSTEERSDLSSSSGGNVASAGELKPRFQSVYDTPKFQALKRAQGRYSFVAGTISNFSFSPDGNNQYSCTTEITSFSKAMAKLRNRNQENIRNEDETQDESEIQQDLLSYLQSSNFEDDLERLAEGAGDTASSRAGGGNKNVVKVNAGNNWNRKENSKQSYTYFLTWEQIEKIVNDHAGYVINQGTQDEIRLLKLDSAGSIIGNYQTGERDEKQGDPLHLRTLNPFVCLVDAGDVTSNETAVDLRSFSDSSASPRIDARLKDDASIDPKREGFLYNLYFEYQLVREAFENTDTIHEGLKYMLDKASAACFSIWDFKIIADSGRAKVIDTNVANESVETILTSKVEEHVFRPNTADSILRDFSFDTNLTDAIKSRIVAQKHISLGGSENDSDSPGKERNAAINGREDGDAQFFQGFDGQDVITGNGMKRTAETREEGQSQIAGLAKPPSLDTVRSEGSYLGLGVFSTDVDFEDQRKDLVSTLVDLEGETYRKLLYKNQKGDSKARVFARRMQADDEAKSPVNGNNVLNINAQFTLDGIGGLTAYQGLRIENIPRVFRNNGLFMIDSISHSVSTDDWTTEVKTSYIVRNQIGDDSGNGEDG